MTSVGVGEEEAEGVRMNVRYGDSGDGTTARVTVRGTTTFRKATTEQSGKVFTASRKERSMSSQATRPVHHELHVSTLYLLLVVGRVAQLQPVFHVS